MSKKEFHEDVACKEIVLKEILSNLEKLTKAVYNTDKLNSELESFTDYLRYNKYYIEVLSAQLQETSAVNVFGSSPPVVVKDVKELEEKVEELECILSDISDLVSRY